MPERLSMIYNAADAINDFHLADLEYPYVGDEATPEDLLKVFELKRKRLYALLGFTVDHLEVILQIHEIEDGVMIVSDRLENLTEEWRCRVADDPMPRVLSPHGDLQFFIDRVS